MTYTVNLTDTNQDMLLGLINYHNGAVAEGGVPHIDTWDKAVISKFNGSINHVPDGELISTTFNSTDKGHFVFKKIVTFSEGVNSIKIWGDDGFDVYIDGVRIPTIPWKQPDGGQPFDVTPGTHAFVVVTNNNKDYMYNEFALYNDGVLFEKSDTSWSVKVFDRDGEWGISEYFYKSATFLTPENVLFIRPPVTNPTGAGSTVTKDARTDVASPHNYTTLWWDKGILFTGNVGAYAKPDALCEYISPTATYNGSTPWYVQQVIEVAGDVIFECSADSRWVLYVDGTQRAASDHVNPIEFAVGLTPGIHVFRLLIYNQNGSGSSFAAFKITDGDTIHRSDDTWPVAINATPELGVHGRELIFDNVNNEEYTVTVADGYDYIAVPSDGIVTVYVAMPNINSFGEVTFIIEPGVPWNTTVEIVTKLPEYNKTGYDPENPNPEAINTVKVNYNRIPVAELFADIGPIGIREFNLDVVSGTVTLNQKVLDELNRRHGVNYILDDFRITSMLTEQGKRVINVQARDQSLAYIGFIPVDIIDSLTTRVYNTQLVGFTVDHVEA